MKNMTPEDIKYLSSFLSIVCDETRLLILYALNEKPLCVSEIVVKTGKSQSLVSHQLAVLKRSGLVSSKREGNRVIYNLKGSSVEKILNTAHDHIIKED